ncbi:MAG: SDR family NAD(P)-dependent oxidoreductase [Filimonas sp.]|nr:SDR family NAD(P)-dependent oxidoreductase [Filimonas sp.]
MLHNSPLSTIGFKMYFTLVTGASGGIGKALATECARKGMHLLLVALPGFELTELVSQIRKTYKVHCYGLGVDMSEAHASQEVYDWVKENDFNVNVLINNVGVGSKGEFDKLSTCFYQKQINLNVVTTCMMTRLFLDDLKRNAPAHIMNTGSMGGFYALPNKAVYSATKSFVYSLTKSLRLELANTGVQVSVLCPGGTDSNEKTIAINKDLKGIAKMSILQPDEVAKEAIDKMLKGKSRIIPGTVNKICYHISRLVPEFVHNFFIGRAFKHVHKHGYSEGVHQVPEPKMAKVAN